MNRDEQPQEKETPTQPATSSSASEMPSFDAEPTTTPESTSDMSSSEPTSVAGQSEMTPMSSVTGFQPKKRPKWLVPAIVAGILVILIGGGAAAYKFWYQNPQKVISDGLMNAIAAKSFTYSASVKAKGDSGTYTVAVTGVSKDGAGSADASVDMTIRGKSYKIDASLVIDNKSNIYVKVANVDRLLADFEAQLPPSTRTVVGDFIQKINDQWIVISNDRIKTFSDAYAKMQKCTQTVAEKLQNDKSYSSEVTDLYKAHPFFKITKELGSKDGSLGYEIAEDTAGSKAFAEGLKKTKAYKMMRDCDSTFTMDSSQTPDTTSDPKVEIWVSRWSHEITKISATQTESGDTTSFVLEPVFNTSKTVVTPKNAKSVDELMQDLQELQSALIQSSLESQMYETESESPFTT